MAVTIKHGSLTGAAANPNVLVDGPKWDADHAVTGLDEALALKLTALSNLSDVPDKAAARANLNAAFLYPSFLTGIDLDTVITTGTYATDPTVTNTPSSDYWFIDVQVYPTNFNYCRQMARSAIIAPQQWWSRVLIAGVWQPWDVVILSGVQPLTASQRGQVAANLQFITPPQGRLTLTSAVSVPAASVAGATTVYYTPAVGNQVPIYNGTNMVPTAFAQLSQTTTDATKSPAAVAASSVYDIFVWNDAGTIRATRGPAWTNDATRSAGTALVLVNGIYLNNAAITNGPAASRGTYVGTIRSNAASTIDFIFGSSATGGGAAFFYVWNLYNQAYFSTDVFDATANWTYTSATVRAANNSTSNRISFVSGLAINGFNASYQETLSVPGVINAWGYFGVSLDSTTTLQKYSRVINSTTSGALAFANSAVGTFPAQLGAHFVQAVEASDGTNTSTFLGQGAGQALNAGLWQ